MNTTHETQQKAPATDDERMDAEGILLAMKGCLYILLSRAERNEETAIRFFLAASILAFLSGIILTLHFTL